MKTLMKIFKFFLKVIGVLVGLALLFGGLFAIMIYFTNPEYTAELVEDEFIESTGQKMVISGGVEFKPGKELKTTFSDSMISLESNIGEIDIQTQKLFVAIPWLSLFHGKIDKAPIEANQIRIKVKNEGKLTHDFTSPSFSGDLEKTCCDVLLNNIKLFLKQGILTGNLVFSGKEQSIQITGKIHSDKWTLEQPIDSKTKTVIFEGSDNLSGNIEFTADKLITPQGEMNNVEGIVDLKAKTLTIKSSHVILTHRFNTTNLVE